MMAAQVDGLMADARLWQAAVRGRAPAYHRILDQVLELLAEGGAVAEQVDAAWRGRSFSIFYERPLLLLASIRFDALGRGEGHPLWGALGAAEPDATSVTREAVMAALASESLWRSMRDRFVQTNDTSRAVAWLWPARLAGCDGAERPLALVELGTAAGLNLVADALPNVWTDAAGGPLAVATSLDTRLRLGIDLRPLDVDDEDAVRWLRACVWAGETERLARLEAAVSAFRSSEPRPVLEAGNVGDAPARLVRVAGELPRDGLVIAFQTIVRDYLDGTTGAAYERGMREWLAATPMGRALWLELEIAASGDDPARLAVIRAHAPDGSGGVASFVLGRTGYHPVDVVTDARAVSALCQLLPRP